MPPELPSSSDHIDEAQKSVVQNKDAYPAHECLNPNLTQGELEDLQGSMFSELKKHVGKYTWMQKWTDEERTTIVPGVGAAMINGEAVPMIRFRYDKNLPLEDASTIQDGEIPVVPYLQLVPSGIMHLPDTDEFLHFLGALIETPEDIHNIIAPPFSEWQDYGGKIDPYENAGGRFPQLESSEVTLAKGGGSCTELSWLAKELFEILSCKTGVDYDARVIGVGTHAVCVYTDENGDLNSLDQGDHYQNVEDGYSASDLFEQDKPMKELELHEGISQLLYDLDPETMKNNYKRIQIDIYEDYTDDFFDPSKYAPEYAQYRKANFYFQDGNRAFFQNGQLVHTIHKNGEKFWYDGTKQLTHMKDKSGSMHYYKNGRLIQVKRPGKVETNYDPITGIKTDTSYRDVKEVYDKYTGEVKKVVYENHSEHFDKDGDKTMVKHFLKEDPKRITRIEYFDKARGTIHHIDQLDPRTQKITTRIYFDPYTGAVVKMENAAGQEINRKASGTQINVDGPDWGTE